MASLSQASKDHQQATSKLELRLAEVERHLAARDRAAADPPVKPPRQSETEQEEEDDPHSILEYRLGETIWDTVAIVGLPELGSGASAVLLASMLLNALTQAYICWVLVHSEKFISQNAFKDLLQAAERWRISEAHDHTAVDAGGVSLVSRVCGQDAALSVAGTQSTILGEINAYLGLQPYQLSPTSVGTGPLLCSVCLFLFTVLILRELRRLFCSVHAVGALPRGCTRLEEGRLVAISRQRLACVLAMGVLRATIAIALLYTGVTWLASTSSITNLILNAAALGFVLDLDERIYETTVPARVQSFIASLEPLRYRRAPYYMEALAPLVSTIGIVTTCILALVMPISRDMLAVKQALCAGNLDFAVGENPAGFAVARLTTPFGQASQEHNLKVLAVQELRALPRDGTPRYSGLGTSDFHFARDVTMTLEDLSEVSMCEDMDVFAGGVAVKEQPFGFLTIREETGLYRGQSFAERPFRCADYQAFCDSEGLMRVWCPLTCGCDDARSGLAFSQPAKGCPRSCVARAASAIANESCVDMNVSNTSAWERYWRGYQKAMLDELPLKAPEVQRFVAHQIATGCSGLAPDPLGVQDFCDDTFPALRNNGIGAISAFCPARCCRRPNPTAFCPSDCGG